MFKIDTLTAFNEGKDNLFKKLFFEKGNYLCDLDIIWYNEKNIERSICLISLN